MNSLLQSRRSLAVAVGGVAVAGALFGAGFLTASASGSDNDPANSVPATGRTVTEPLSNVARPGLPAASAPVPARSIPASFGGEDAAGRGGSYGVGIAPQPFCQGNLPPVLTGSTIDLSRAGFVLTPLGDGYTLRSINVRTEAKCDESGSPTGESVVVVDTTWVHDATGVEAYVSQRPSADAAANLRTPYNGVVWSDGYGFTVWVNAYPIRPLDGGSPEASEAQGAEVLRAVLSRLAPSVPDRCYYEQTEGSWSDLAALGVGDPRPAIPAGLDEQYAQFTVFTAPPADCNAVKLEGQGSFSASWGDRSGASVNVGVYSAGEGSQSGPGYIDSGSAYWVSNGFGYNVSAYGPGGPMGSEVVKAIATAMDPDFSAACFVSTRELAAAELAALGFAAPVAPEGFKVTVANLQVAEAPGDANCGVSPDAGYYPQYNLHWTMENGDGAVIEATASRHPQAGEPEPGFIHDGGINWTGSDRTFYAVYSYSKDDSTRISRDTMIAVARSMDPSLDPSTLQEGGGPIAIDKPAAGGPVTGR
ncbi:MAG: hypothetical protein AB7T37_09670 [Dehalococcoidia bacterium]